MTRCLAAIGAPYRQLDADSPRVGPTRRQVKIGGATNNFLFFAAISTLLHNLQQSAHLVSRATI